MKKLLLAVGVLLIGMLSAQVNIAVMDFKGIAVAPDDAIALTDRLRAELFLTGKFVVLEREKMDAILNEQQFQLSGCTSDACAVEAGQLLAVEQMVAGSISKIGQTYSVTARLISVEKGDVLGVGKCDLKGDIGDVINCLSGVAGQLAGKQPVPRSKPILKQAPAKTNNERLPEETIITGTVTDIDGNTYRTIKVGDQWWMAENLKVTHYRNGDPILNVNEAKNWSSLVTGAYYNYDNDSSNAITYGRLYNWYAVSGNRNIAPTGWHVPSNTEWKKLVDYLGGAFVAGGKLKEAGTTHWASPNAGASNKSGFAALPGGYRNYNGIFLSMGYYAYFWSSTEYGSYYAWYRRLYCIYAFFSRFNYYKQSGFSVRLVRD